MLNTLRGELRADVKVSGYRTGALFESYMVTELIRLNDYLETGFKFYHWRTDRGKEVDCVLSRGPSDQARAIELKSAETPSERDLAGLISFADEHPTAALYCLCRTPRPYRLGKIDGLPWREGLRAVIERA